jgi:hypothetical protein
MLLSDGECPNCGEHQLSLNTGDLLECPGCHFVCANIFGVLASVMPFLGAGRFRFDDGRLPRMDGVAFAKKQAASVLPDEQAIFFTRASLQEYVKQLPSEPTVTAEGSSLWRGFTVAFCQELSLVDPATLAQVWSAGERTRFYAREFLPNVAAKLRLQHGTEEFTVDYVMAARSRRELLVPKIYLESENVFDSADHEIRKLCSLNSPLRVLLTVRDQWKDLETHGFRTLRDWQGIVRSHAEGNEYFAGVIGVIIGSRMSDRIVFRACAFGADGDLTTPLQTIIECKLP